MAASRKVKDILDDINRTITKLYSKELVRNIRGTSETKVGDNLFKISFAGKNDSSSVVFDKHVTGTKIMNILLENLQYNVLLYDKGLIQAEFIVDGEEVIKERLVFMKKHNKIWNIAEIEEHEILEEDWFSDVEGIPIILRVDYAPEDHVECEHAATHLTISNHESCRVPIKGIVTFSEFVQFILLHFYDIKLDMQVWRSSSEDTITELEKQMVHINWK